ncbi:Heterodisulfide reductase subunit A-like protein [uncultured archaeon]|nr:Heterodisulfide reductase subunit A-like protein [uncultured archaeon]
MVKTLGTNRTKELFMKKYGLKVDLLKCVFCGGCVSVCPHNVISLYDETKLEINNDICKHCNICTTFCPMDALRIATEVTEGE